MRADLRALTSANEAGDLIPILPELFECGAKAIMFFVCPATVVLTCGCILIGASIFELKIIKGTLVHFRLSWLFLALELLIQVGHLHITNEFWLCIDLWLGLCLLEKQNQ